MVAFPQTCEFDYRLAPKPQPTVPPVAQPVAPPPEAAEPGWLDRPMTARAVVSVAGCVLSLSAGAWMGAWLQIV